MLSGIDPLAEKFLADLRRVQERAERAQNQITSGLRITKASDSPDDVGRILETHADLDRTTQVLENLRRVKVEVDAAEHSVAMILPLLDRASTLASQGASNVLAAKTKLYLATAAEAVLRQLIGLANTTVEGRYIFSGDADTTSPYGLDLNAPNGATAYAGAAATRQFEDSNGTRISVSRTAQDIFDDPGGRSAFAAVNSLRVALVADDQAGIEAAMTGLRDARDLVSQQLAFYGTVQNEVAAGIDLASRRQTQIRVALADTREADLVEAAIELQQATFHREAALNSRARIPRTSLFDYLG